MKAFGVELPHSINIQSFLNCVSFFFLNAYDRITLYKIVNIKKWLHIIDVWLVSIFSKPLCSFLLNTFGSFCASRLCGRIKRKLFPLPASWRNWPAAAAPWRLGAAWTAPPRVRMIELHAVWLWQSSRSEVTLCLLSVHGKATEVPYVVSNIWHYKKKQWRYHAVNKSALAKHILCATFLMLIKGQHSSVRAAVR